MFQVRIGRAALRLIVPTTLKVMLSPDRALVTHQRRSPPSSSSLRLRRRDHRPSGDPPGKSQRGREGCSRRTASRPGGHDGLRRAQFHVAARVEQARGTAIRRADADDRRACKCAPAPRLVAPASPRHTVEVAGRGIQVASRRVLDLDAARIGQGSLRPGGHPADRWPGSSRRECRASDRWQGCRAAAPWSPSVRRCPEAGRASARRSTDPSRRNRHRRWSRKGCGPPRPRRPERSPPVFPAMIAFRIVSVPRLSTPPLEFRQVAVLALTVESLRVNPLVSRGLEIPPPKPWSAKLPLTVEFWSVSVPWLAMPPPWLSA